MKNGKVIFIGGTSYSGSTFFDLILGNDPAGFSCGEVNALFFPYRKHHLDPICGCGKRGCYVWQEVKKKGVDNLYATIFNLFPGLEFVVDSSKEPFWIAEQCKRLRKVGIETKNILIWKTPYEFAYSYKKRGEKNWQKEWVNYHRLYFTLINDFIPVSYYELANEKDTLRNICQFLGIKYTGRKHEYWNKEHHLLFGNNSAKIHLYNKDDSLFSRINNNLIEIGDNSDNKEYRTIYYKEISRQDLIEEVKDTIDKHAMIKEIIYNLSSRKISNSSAHNMVKLCASEFICRKTKRIIRNFCNKAYRYYAR